MEVEAQWEIQQQREIYRCLPHIYFKHNYGSTLCQIEA